MTPEPAQVTLLPVKVSSIVTLLVLGSAAILWGITPCNAQNPESAGSKKAADAISKWDGKSMLPMLEEIEVIRQGNGDASNAIDYLLTLLRDGAERGVDFIAADRAAAILAETEELPNEALPLIRWYLDDEENVMHRIHGINALHRIKPEAADNAFVSLSDSTRTIEIWGILRVALERKLPIPEATVIKWSTHPGERNSIAYP